MAEDLAEGHALEPEEGAGGVALAKGWHADPFGRHRFRHFDGDSWTGYVSDGSTTSWDSTPLAPTVDRPTGMPGIGTAIVGFAIGVGASFVISRSLHESRAVEMLLSSLGLWAGLVGAVVVVSARRGTGSLVRDIGLRFRWADIGLGFAGAIAGRMLSGFSVAPIPLPHRHLGQSDRDLLRGSTPSAWGWVVLVIVVCVGAPLIEEIFFRGLLQSRLVQRLGPVVGIPVASVMFGAAHLIAWNGPLSLAYAWAVAAGGLVLGVVYWSSGRLGTSIATHAFFNAQAVLAVALLR